MLKNIWASGGISMRTKLRIFNSNVKSVLLYGCETWSTIQVMQKKKKKKDPDILQHLSETHLQNPMVREDPKWRSVGVSMTGTRGQADTAEVMGLDRTHPQEASIQHHTPSPDLKPAEKEKERPASQQLEARHWSRAETAGDQLVRNDQNSPEQRAMDGGHWWPMLHRERWA